MDSFKTNVRGKLRSRIRAEKNPARAAEDNRQPGGFDGKSRARAEVKELEQAEKTMPLATPSPVLSGDRSTVQAAPTEEPTITSIPILHTLAATNDTVSSLLSLPPDLILTLTSHLSWNGLLALRSTCSPLYNLLNSHYLTILRHNLILTSLTTESLALASYRLSHPRSPRGQLWDLFFAAFEWQLLERPAKHLTCYDCLELKPLNAFVERMSSRGTGLGGPKASQRRCKDCMRRNISIAGIWWREHWVRKADTKRQRGRGERAWYRLLHREQQSQQGNIKPGEEVGVCTMCGTGQFELFWGCAGCFEKEEDRRRKQEWALLGIERADDAEVEGWVRWVLERAENHRGRKEKRRRKRFARRAEGAGNWWSVRRLLGWMSGNRAWAGTWGDRVEALVEYLHGPDYQLHSRRRGHDDDDDLTGDIGAVTVWDHRSSKAKTEASGEQVAWQAQIQHEWKAVEQIPLKKDRRETRCTLCWVPTSRPSYTPGMAHELRLSLERCCEDCQVEAAEKQRKRRHRRSGGVDAGSAEEALEAVRELYTA